MTTRDPTPIARRPYVGPLDDDAPLDDLELVFVETMIAALLTVWRTREAAARDAAIDQPPASEAGGA